MNYSYSFFRFNHGVFSDHGYILLPVLYLNMAASISYNTQIL